MARFHGKCHRLAHEFKLGDTIACGGCTLECVVSTRLARCACLNSPAKPLVSLSIKEFFKSRARHSSLQYKGVGSWLMTTRVLREGDGATGAGARAGPAG